MSTINGNSDDGRTSSIPEDSSSTSEPKRGRARRWASLAAVSACATALSGAVACSGGDATEDGALEGIAQDKSGTPATLAPILDPTTIPRFVNQMPRLPTFVPTLIKNSSGQVIRKEFTVRIAKFTTQQLPPGFPSTLLFGYGGNVRGPNNSVIFQRTSPGPTFEQTRLIPDITRYRNELVGAHPLPVDPTLDWANPNNFPKPTPPFVPFPPGYPQAQTPITHTTHTHGLEVLPEFDGTPDTWFTQNGIVGPEFVSNDYHRPNTNDSAAFWYHDHAFGVTRLDVGFGLSGYAILRDPAGEPLDRVGNADIVGFEDPNDWTTVVGTPQAGIDTRRTQGRFSTSLTGGGFTQLAGRSFALNQTLPASVQLDFFLPSQQPNPWYFGAVQLYANCPSKGVNRAFLSQVELTGKPTNQFSTLTFTIPSAVRSSIGSSCEDFFFETSLNVPSNATGTYLFDNLRGITITPTTPLPEGEFEVPMILQDRSFRTDGSVFYPTVGRNPDVNPYWELTVDGNTNLMNGKVWPNFDVKRHAYRFRVLNSANQRFYNLFFSNGMSFQVIGSDGGYLEQPHTVTSFQIGVTERVDFVVDFSQFAPGTKIVLRNDRQHFPPIGEPVDPNTDGTVMQFTVQGGPAVPPKPIPAVLNPIEDLVPNRPERILIQNVQSDDQGRILQAELDGQLFHEETTELPTIGATEDWTFVNLTPLDHNKHVHLIQFLLVERQNIDAARYLADWIAVNGNPPFDHPTIKLPYEPYLLGEAEGPFPEESGWKDTIRTPAGQITKIRMRFAPQTTLIPAAPGVNTFPGFNPINGIGFVWHCHLVEHEDNEMMRPMTVIPIWRSNTSYPVGNVDNPGVIRGVVDFNGVNFRSRVAHTSTSQTPPQRPDLWERINNQNGDWAIQTIYRVGDRVRFTDGSIYRALQLHQATPANSPPNPAFWMLVL
jgi:FtsP/CotA-like multicopper oxidase with cupredoxin domain